MHTCKILQSTVIRQHISLYDLKSCSSYLHRLLHLHCISSSFVDRPSSLFPRCIPNYDVILLPRISSLNLFYNYITLIVIVKMFVKAPYSWQVFILFSNCRVSLIFQNFPQVNETLVFKIILSVFKRLRQTPEST
jgi:hypothetical protein